MKLSLIASLLLTAANQEDTRPLTLRWKLPEGGGIAFETSFQQVKRDQAVILDLNVEELLKQVKAATGEKGEGLVFPPETAEALKKILPSLKPPQEYSMTTVMKDKGEGKIGFLLVPGKGSAVQTGVEEFDRMLKNLEGTVQLRGDLSPSGEILSFWLPQRQKNMIALFCGLPPGPVRKGDRWSLAVNLIEMGHGFIPSKSRRVNTVELKNVETRDGKEVVASLEYLIAESVEGDFQNPMGGGTTPTTMAFTFMGRAEFSVTRGSWRTYLGRLSARSTGFMKSESEQEFALRPLDKVPEEFLRLR